MPWQKTEKEDFLLKKRDSTKWVEDQTQLLLQRNWERKKNCGGNLYNKTILIVRKKINPLWSCHKITNHFNKKIEKKKSWLKSTSQKQIPVFVWIPKNPNTRVTRLHRHTNQDSDSRQRGRGRSKRKEKIKKDVLG